MSFQNFIKSWNESIYIKPDGVTEWFPIKTAPTTGRELIWLKVPNKEPQQAYSNTWWISGHSVECKPTHWAPV